jgi:hypothetical protein
MSLLTRSTSGKTGLNDVVGTEHCSGQLKVIGYLAISSWNPLSSARRFITTHTGHRV